MCCVKDSLVRCVACALAYVLWHDNKFPREAYVPLQKRTIVVLALVQAWQLIVDIQIVALPSTLHSSWSGTGGTDLPFRRTALGQ